MKYFLSLVLMSFALLSWADSYDDLISSVKLNDVNHVQKMLKRGFEVETTDKDGNTLLSIASNEGSSEVVNLLLHNGANVNARNSYGETPIMLAILHGYIDSVKSLLNAHAKINHSGWTPLLYAAQTGNLDIVNLLLSYGANVNAPSDNGSTPLMMAAHGGYIDIMRRLLQNRADPNAITEQGLTALSIAVKREDSTIAELLLEVGATR